jgi:hypothetical protein
LQQKEQSPMREINIREKNTNATKKNYLIQQQNKATKTIKTKMQCEMQHQRKETNATKKYYLLQQQNKATSTIKQSAKARCNIKKE